MKTGIPPITLEEIERLLASSADVIHRYEAIICVEENGAFFSGVFAESFGYKGILTAGHCAMDFLAGEKFILVISETLHHLSIQSESVEHVPVGFDGIEKPSLGGPDLSFVIIRDEELIHLIESQGYAFYNLDDKRPEVEAIFAEPVAKFNWCVAGGPKTMVQVTAGPQKLINANAAAMRCNLVEIDLQENNFDYVKLRILSDAYGFPSCYDGVSGGGIWYQRFVTDDGKTYGVAPILTGIAFSQSEPTEKKGYNGRHIVGHCRISIYRQMKLALMAVQLREKRQKNKNTPEG